MKIRKANSKDFPVITFLIKELWKHRRLNKSKLQTIYNKHLKSGKLFFLHIEDGEPNGLITLNTKLDIENLGKVGLIEEFVVSEKYRGKGIGKKLMNHALKEAKKLGCVEVQLYSNLKRKSAHKFYKKSGFKNTAYLFWKSL